MQAIFIRHGQSTGNAGIPSDDLSAIELTELGWQQARAVAISWQEPPSLIVTSPYVRAQQTAEPTRARFPGVPLEVWPIHEFTYLDPVRWNGTLSAERRPYIDRYWKTADPMYCDGEEAESFSTLLGRVRAALERLEAMPQDALVYLFSHGQFIQALNLLIRYEGMTEGEIMRMFLNYDREHPIGNGDRLILKREQEGGFHVEKMDWNQFFLSPAGNVPQATAVEAASKSRETGESSLSSGLREMRFISGEAQLLAAA